MSHSNAVRLEHPALAPTRLAGQTLANRLAVAPMTRVSASPAGVPTPAMVDYYARFARGGFGLVITEGTYTDETFSQGYLHQPGLASPAQVSAWTEVTAKVHAEGARIVAQLMHAGALSQGNPHRDGTVGPSAIRPRGEMMPEYRGSGLWPVPAAMTAYDIDEAVEGFVDAAAHACAAGFDGIEVHAANGYLLDQFLTTYTNHRDDEYGGSVANRVRLTARIVTAIRVALGPDFWVGVRLSQTKVNDFEYRWPGGSADARVIFAALGEAGATYLHVASEGRNWIETARLDSDGDGDGNGAGPGGTITALAREVSGLPVIANGGMHDVEQAAQVLAGGHADLLALARGALANPDFPQRLAAGERLRAFDHSMLTPMATLENAERWRRAVDLPSSSAAAAGSEEART
ncbi:NADH:flavin oxidoreductase [Actinopolymorpha sp. B17G11]|uniref:NADH:flavin oxidoreductase n=1 Tax=Actinopolymorpha sp. B17G11 TaxID=3160861 RepID=UPI0032E3AE8C